MDVETVGPAVIGTDCTIESGTRLGAYTVLGSHCRVLANVHIDRCVLHDSVYVASGGRLVKRTVLARRQKLPAGPGWSSRHPRVLA